jgi:hypothetical protein
LALFTRFTSMLRWWFPVLLKSRHCSWLVNYYVKPLAAFVVINILHIQLMHGLWIIQRTYEVEVKLLLYTADTQGSNFCPDTSPSNGRFPCLPPVRPQNATVIDNQHKHCFLPYQFHCIIHSYPYH